MKLTLEEVNWQQELAECLEVFYEVVRTETERYIPKKLRRKSSRPLWMTSSG